MTTYALNGLGRIGKLALRPLLERGAKLSFLNDAVGDPAMHAHLLEFDSIQGRWHHAVTTKDSDVVINGHKIATSQEKEINAVDWSGCDVVIEATGVHRSRSFLDKYLATLILGD